MRCIIDRIATLSTYAKAQGYPSITLLVEQNATGGLWQASICEFCSKMPLLDNEGNQSLAAVGSSPIGATVMLNEKLKVVP